ncbi:DUF883 family protein [Zwartia vadi]|uniref:DUF883 family protein n=1 Tax=Zwartia vadi TaxID=3058168 RepID=UPI0025B4F880|nr:DUF883 family protein [Zwartia vadi]MDN3987233.1 DUF883 family protein [Zwartia vadi]
MKNTKETSQDSSAQEKLLEGMKAALDEAEGFLREAASASGDQAQALRAKAVESLQATREALHDTKVSVLRESRRVAREADEYVHDNPWQAIAAAGVIGLLIGVLISRR